MAVKPLQLNSFSKKLSVANRAPENFQPPLRSPKSQQSFMAQ